MTDEQTEAFADPGLPTDDLSDRELEDGVSHDPTTVDEEGQTYMPPVDPPTGLDDHGDPTFAAGFGGDVDADADDADHRRSASVLDDEMTERIRERLAADSLGQEYADRLGIVAQRGIVIVAGVVEDLDVQDHILGVVAGMPGVRDVQDRLLPE